MANGIAAKIVNDMWISSIDPPYFMRRHDGGFVEVFPDLSMAYNLYAQDIANACKSVHFITDAANFDEACLTAVLDRGGKAWAFKTTSSLVVELRRSQLSYAWLEHSMWVCGVIPVIKDE